MKMRRYFPHTPYKWESEDSKYIITKNPKERTFKRYIKDTPIEKQRGVIVCGNCFLTTKKKDRIKVRTNGFHTNSFIEICKNCLEKHYSFCVECSTYVKKQDGQVVNEEFICFHCMDRLYFTCLDCGRKVRKGEVGDEYLNINGNAICMECIEENYEHCTLCGNLCNRNELTYVDEEDNYICRQCYNRNFNIIKPYNYTPNFTFNKMPYDNELFMGIELEVDNPDRNPDKNNYWVNKINKKIKNKKYSKHFYYKHDGTVDGFEIVTQPLTLNFIHKNINFKELLSMLKELNFTSYKSGKCGLHIHLNKSFFNSYELTKLRTFFSVYRKPIFIFSKRTNGKDGYCKAEEFKKEDFLTMGLHQDGKYWSFRINTGSKNTVEMRIFRGTLNHRRFIATLQFADAVAHYIKEISLVHLTKNSEGWELFISWAKKKGYNHFIDYVSNKKELLEV